MRKYISSILIAASLLASTSCKKYLDVNENPNQATESTPQYVLPNALAVTAATLVNQYHVYGSNTVGYEVNAGGFGGWGTLFTYNYSTSENTGMWTGVFGNLRDYQYILNSTDGVANQTYYNAMARIMKCFDYQLLVDQYGDVPYTDALKGAEFLTPKYDKADAIYQDLVVQLNKAISDINGANANTQLSAATADIMFKGDMGLWKKFANTLKLRVLLRASNSSISAFVNTNLSNFNTTEGFLTTDAIVNPGYIVTAGKQNPLWNLYHSDSGGSQSGFGRQYIPSTYVMAFYNGTKVQDPKRGQLTYRNYGSTPTNQLGNETNSPNAPDGAPAWYIGAGKYGSAGNTVGILKGPTMGQPMLLAAESYFLLAEAALKGHPLAGDDLTNFNLGITASYTYLEKNINNTLESGSPAADLSAYKAANTGNYLVAYSTFTDAVSGETKATSEAQKLEAIITQKYIALNFIHGHEAWNEYRRTGYPVSTGTSATSSFASRLSQSTRPDRLPVRVNYPASEYTFNPNNVPSGISVFTSRIFWDAN